MQTKQRKGKLKHNGRVTVKACKARRGLPCSFTSIMTSDLGTFKLCSWCGRKKPNA